MRISASAVVTWKKLLEEDSPLPAISENTIENYLRKSLVQREWKSL